MRACTAAVTEISFNYDTEDTYRAEVDFIDKRTWQRELRFMIGDLQEKDKVFFNNKDLATAIEKIKVVYPEYVLGTSSYEVKDGLTFGLGILATNCGRRQ